MLIKWRGRIEERTGAEAPGPGSTITTHRRELHWWRGAESNRHCRFSRNQTFNIGCYLISKTLLPGCKEGWKRRRGGPSEIVYMLNTFRITCSVKPSTYAPSSDGNNTVNVTRPDTSDRDLLPRLAPSLFMWLRCV